MARRVNRVARIRRISEPQPDAAEIRSLVDGLHSGDSVIRRNGRQSLIKIGRPAVPSLISALKDPNDNVRWEAAKALGEIRDPAAAEALVDALEDKSFGVRWLAGDALTALGRRSVVPLLQALVRRSNSVWLREGASRVLGGLRSEAMRQRLAPAAAALGGPAPAEELPLVAQEILNKIRRPRYRAA